MKETTGVTLQTEWMQTHPPRRLFAFVYAVVSLLFYLCGIYGTLLALMSAFPILCRQETVYLGILMYCTLLWAICWRRPKWSFGAYALLLLLATYYQQALWPQLLQALAQILRHGFQYETANLPEIANASQADFTMLVLLLSAVAATLLFQLLFVWNVRNSLLIIPLLVGSICAIFGETPSFFSLFLLTLFYVGMLVLRKQRQPKSRRITPESQRTAAVYSSIAVAILLGGFFLALHFFPPRVAPLLQNTYAWGSRMLTSLGARLQDTSLRPAEHTDRALSGQINRGNQVITNQEQLAVTLSEKPDEALYLKGFSGSHYNGERWSVADERHFFQRIAQAGSDIASLHAEIYNRPYLLAEKQNAALARRASITIYGNSVDEFSPYISQFVEQTEGGNQYQYYQAVDFARIRRGMKQKDLQSDLAEAYTAYVKESFLAFQTELAPRLEAYCKENAQTGVEDITEFILKTLQENTNYTLTPGRIPANENMVDYFLFVGKKGYCQHYATAATLMYRIYGIPARYVSGYLAFPSDFTAQGDGSYQAILTDRRAHAWVEIYEEGIGWRPIETTSSATLEMLEAGTEAETTTTPATAQQPTQAAENLAPTQPVAQPKTGAAVWLLIAGLLLAVVLIVVLLYLRWRIRKKRLHSHDPIPLFDHLMELLQLDTFMAAYTGDEESFAQAFTACVPAVSQADAVTLIRLVYQATYGKQPLSANEKALIHQIYRTSVASALQNMPWFRQWYYKYWKVYW